MINVRMGQKHIVNISRIHRNFLIFIDVRPLFHTTVYKYHLFAGLKHMTAACHLVIRTQKCQPHSLISLIYRYCFCYLYYTVWYIKRQCSFEKFKV